MGLLREVGYPAPRDPAVSKRFKANGRTDTKPERALRSQLHRRGMRFRKDFPIRVGRRLVRPDVVFTGARVAVFLDGCFWHSCPEHGTSPRRNSTYWTRKLHMNVERDRRVTAELGREGWHVIRVWEHEAAADAAARITKAVQLARETAPPN
jgi:DNA mismatch endonuclease, patch repair protein